MEDNSENFILMSKNEFRENSRSESTIFDPSKNKVTGQNRKGDPGLDDQNRTT